jgi:hypothetical protein
LAQVGDKKKFLTMFLTLKTTVDDATELPTDKLTPASVEWCRSVGSDAKTVADVLAGPDAKVALNRRFYEAPRYSE